MSIQIKLKNSVVQDSTPSTSDLPVVGELALNANINSIGGFMRASNNTIVKIFGPGSVTTPTATTTVSGIAELATSSETTTGTATNRVVTPAGLNAVTVAERATSNTNYLAKAGGTLTGVLTATAGSNSAPAINFGDSDSGIFGGTNTVSLAAGGATKLTVAGEVTVLSSLLIDSDSEQLRLGDDQDLKLYHNGSNGFLQNTTGAQMYRSATHMFENGSGATEYARIDSSGRLLVGHSSNFSISGSNPRFQLIGASDSTAHGYVGIFSANNIGANFSLVKSRNGTIGSQGLVQENDFVGNINFVASDGSDAAHSAARISAVIDGTAAANDLPGRLEFMTTADGSSSPTPKVVIKANGNIGCGTSSPGAFVHLSTDTPVVRLTDTSTNRFAQIVSEDGNLRFDADNDGDQSSSNITFRVDGGERLKIDSNGFLGINQGSPATRLDLRMDNGTAYDGNVQTASFHGARIQNASGHTGGGAFTGVQFNITGDSQNRICSIGMITESSSNKKASLVFGTDDDGNRTEKLRITGDGLVGIGTVSPSTILHVADDDPELTLERTGTHSTSSAPLIQFKGRGPNATMYNFAKIDAVSTGSNNAGHLRFYTNASGVQAEKMRITSAGKVGIANATPAEQLHIGAADNSNHEAIIILNNGGATGNESGIEFRYESGTTPRAKIHVNSSDQILRFSTADSEAMTIDSNQQVGIGTTSPAENLHINSASGSARIRMTSADGSDNMIVFGDQSDNATGSIKFDHSDNSLALFGFNNSERIRISSTGEIGIGTSSPSSIIHATGSESGTGYQFINTHTTSGFGVFIKGGGTTADRYALRVDDAAGNERFRVSANGFIGINQSVPTCQLQVDAGSSGAGTVTALELNHKGNDTSDAVKLNFARAGSDIGSIVLEKVASNNTTDFIFNTRASNTVSEAMRIKGDGNLSIGTTNGSAKLMVARDIADSASNNFSNQTVILTGTIGGNSTNNRTGLYFAPYNSSNQYCPSAISCVAGTNYQSNLKFFTNGAGNGTGHVESYERMRIDGSGNVGIGSAPLSRFSIAQSVSSGHMMVIRNTQTRANNVRYGIDFRDSSNETNVTIVAKQTGSNNQASMEIYANNGSGGNGITGGTSGIKAVTIGPGGITTHKEFGMHDAAGTESSKFLDFGFQGNSCNFRRTDGGDANHATFMAVNSSNVITGDFNDSSDEKLKKNILSVVDGAIENIKKLRPVTFDWIDETRNNDVSGFVAQELKTVLPNLVNGTEYDPTFIDETKGSKGGIKSEGYSINTIGLVAHLTKALQEAIGKIETLETKVAGLEGA